MRNFVTAADMNEEIRGTLRGFLTTMGLQMAAIKELEKCQAPSVTLSGIEGGPSCVCDSPS
jgi:hypothetical protein